MARSIKLSALKPEQLQQVFKNTETMALVEELEKRVAASSLDDDTYERMGELLKSDWHHKETHDLISELQSRMNRGQIEADDDSLDNLADALDRKIDPVVVSQRHFTEGVDDLNRGWTREGLFKLSVALDLPILEKVSEHFEDNR